MKPPDRTKELRPDEWKWLFVEHLLKLTPERGERLAKTIANTWYVAYGFQEPEQAAERWLIENTPWRPAGEPLKPSAPQKRGEGRGMGKQNAEYTQQVIDQAMRRPVAKKKPR